MRREVETSTFSHDGHTLRVDHEPITDGTWGIPTPDPNWEFTDAQGHKHRTVEMQWPTLTWAGDHWVCHVCGEVIVPLTIKLPGVVAYYLDDEPISEERALEITSSWGGRATQA